MRLPLASAALLFLAAAPAAAQRVGPADPNAMPRRTAGPMGEVSREAPVNGVLTLYGNQRCPTDASGAEVVVCVRRSAAEQFRIPKDLRDFKVTPQNESWAKNQSVALATGAQGIGQCTAVGPAAGTGCLMGTTRVGKAEAAERQKDATPDLHGY